MEVSHYSTPTKMLAFTIVAIAKICVPNLFEGLQVIFSDWKDFFMHDPVHHIGTRRVSQGALIVVEWIYFE